jgi:hypothetical protein
VRPLTLSLPSARGTAVPTTLSSDIVFVLVEFLHVDFSGPLTQEPLSVNVWLLVRRTVGRQAEWRIEQSILLASSARLAI